MKTNKHHEKQAKYKKSTAITEYQINQLAYSGILVIKSQLTKKKLMFRMGSFLSENQILTSNKSFAPV